MSHPDEGHCQACIGEFCTALPGCVACSNPPRFDKAEYDAYVQVADAACFPVDARVKQ